MFFFFSFHGAIQVVSIKAIGIAIKLTLEGINQLAYPQTWFFLSVAVICVITQLNYLNRVSLMSSIVFLECSRGKKETNYASNNRKRTWSRFLGVVLSSMEAMEYELENRDISIT